MGVDHRRADVFDKDNQRLSFTVLQCQVFYRFFPGKERGRIVPGYPEIGVLANSCVIICTNFALKSVQKDRII